MPTIPGPGEVGLQNAFLGPGTTDAELADLLGRARTLDVRWWRVDLGDETVRNPDGSYTWAWGDRLIGTITDHGIRPILTVGHSSACNRPAGAPSSYADPDTPDWLASHLRYLTALAARYPDVACEVWNEPNNPAAWKGTPVDPARYGRYLVAAARALREGSADVTVISGGLAPNPTWRPPQFAALMLIATFQAGGADLDGFGLHPYWGPGDPLRPGDWNTFFAQSRQIRGMLLYLGAGPDTLPIWATELGQAAVIGGRVVTTDQAVHIATALRTWREWGEGPAVVYRLDDGPTAHGVDYMGVWGRPAAASVAAAAAAAS